MNNIDDNICFENIEIFESSKFKEFFVKFDNFHQLKIQFFNRNICQDYFKTKINRIFFKKIQNLFVNYKLMQSKNNRLIFSYRRM